MKREVYNGKREQVSRIFGTLKYFSGENRIYKLGELLYVSTANDEDYDLVLDADGHSTFMELYENRDHPNRWLTENSVGTADIIDGSVTSSKLAQDVTNTIEKASNDAAAALEAVETAQIPLIATESEVRSIVTDYNND